jgi:3-deoxy-D-manno-octulosonic-acid transferase
MEAAARVYRIVYNGLLIPLRAAFPLYAVAGRLRGLAPEEFEERLGRLSAPLPGRERGAGLWIQAASVGGGRRGGELMSAIHAVSPDLPMLLTTMTRTASGSRRDPPRE